MSPNLQMILQQAEQLTPEEKLELIQQVAEGLKSDRIGSQPKRSWRELRGITPNILGGKDAQEWVNELRSEWNERQA
jgi:hypothetical protein